MTAEENYSCAVRERTSIITRYYNRTLSSFLTRIHKRLAIASGKFRWLNRAINKNIAGDRANFSSRLQHVLYDAGRSQSIESQPPSLRRTELPQCTRECYTDLNKNRYAENKKKKWFSRRWRCTYEVNARARFQFAGCPRVIVAINLNCFFFGNNITVDLMCFLQ